MSLILKLSAAAILLAAMAIVPACTSTQLAAAKADQQKIESAIAANAAKIQAVCTDVLIVANNPLTDLAAATVPVVGQVQASVKAGCSTAEGIAQMARSASTIPWLQTAQTVMESQGAVLPAPVAPVPVS